MNKQEIRFIDRFYKELFRVPDNSMVTIERHGDIHIIDRVRFIDDYHLSMGGGTYHICQLAELAERNNLLIQPEKLSDEEHAVWQFYWRGKKSLSVQRYDDGWDYTLYDEVFEPTDGGQLDDSELKIEEARNIILEELLDIQFNSLEKVLNFENLIGFQNPPSFRW